MHGSDELLCPGLEQEALIESKSIIRGKNTFIISNASHHTISHHIVSNQITSHHGASYALTVKNLYCECMSVCVKINCFHKKRGEVPLSEIQSGIAQWGEESVT